MLIGVAGFKKNVNRATTQVMMKTGASFEMEKGAGHLERLTQDCVEQGMSRRQMIEITRLRRGIAPH